MSGSTNKIQDPVDEKDVVVYISSGEESDIIEVETTTNDKLSSLTVLTEADDVEKGVGYSLFLQEEWNKVMEEVGSRDPKVVEMELSSRWKLMPEEMRKCFLENCSKNHQKKEKVKQIKRKRGKRVQDPLMPKPPPSILIMWATKERPKIMKELGINGRKAEEVLSNRWKNLGKEEKQALQITFEKKREEHRLAKAEYVRGQSKQDDIDGNSETAKVKVKEAAKCAASGAYFAFVEDTWWKLAAAQPKMEGHELLQLLWQNWLNRGGNGDEETCREDQGAGIKLELEARVEVHVGEVEVVDEKVLKQSSGNCEEQEMTTCVEDVSQTREVNHKHLLQLPVAPQSALDSFRLHLINEKTRDLKEEELVARWVDIGEGGRQMFEQMADADKLRYMADVQEMFVG